MAKRLFGETATRNLLDAIQPRGGLRFSADYDEGRLLHDAKTMGVGEGTSEISCNLIAEFGLELR